MALVLQRSRISPELRRLHGDLDLPTHSRLVLLAHHQVETEAASHLTFSRKTNGAGEQRRNGGIGRERPAVEDTIVLQPVYADRRNIAWVNDRQNFGRILAPHGFPHCFLQLPHPLQLRPHRLRLQITFLRIKAEAKRWELHDIIRWTETVLAGLLLLTLLALILAAAWAAFLTCAIVAGFASCITILAREGRGLASPPLLARGRAVVAAPASSQIPRERRSSPSAEKAARRGQAPRAEAAAGGELSG